MNLSRKYKSLNFFFIPIFLFIIVLIISCSEPSEEKDQYKNRSEKIYTATGIIKKFDTKSIQILHDDIEGFMGSMTMWFVITNPEIQLKTKKLKKGNKIRFVFSKTGYDPGVIIQIDRIHNPGDINKKRLNLK